MTTEEAIKELKETLERLDLYKYFSVKLVGVKMPYGEIDEKKNLNGLWLAISEAIKALEREETCENTEDSFMMFKCSKCEARSVECMIAFEYCPKCGRKVKK